MDIRGTQPGFAPILAACPKAVILGSYPSPKSFENNFYYGHPQNRFWPLLATLCNMAVPTTVQQKMALVTAHSLALWDSIASCRIVGASDAGITDVVPNDIAGLLQNTGIQAVFCNGTASWKIYQKYQYPLTGIAAVRLPSTSPANAAYTMPKLIAGWQPLLPYLQK